MATVNLTCVTCNGDNPCDQCRLIGKALRAAGHSVTQSSRYDALRAASVGRYGFEACIVPLAAHERAIVDAAAALFTSARVAFVADKGADRPAELPANFSFIEAKDWEHNSFPTAWLEGSLATKHEPEQDDTTTLSPFPVATANVEFARQRLKGVARRAQHALGQAGFPQEPRFDLLAALEDEIAWAKMSSAVFGIVLLHVASSAKRKKSPSEAEDELAELGRRIASVVRSSDLIAYGSDSLLVIISDAGSNETRVAANRIKKALRKAVKSRSQDSPGVNSVNRVMLGVAMYPEHGLTRAALLARATASAQAP
jgi:GGDEF domain-containing protein